MLNVLHNRGKSKTPIKKMVSIFTMKRQEECFHNEFLLDFTKCCFQIVTTSKCAPRGRKGSNSHHIPPPRPRTVLRIKRRLASHILSNITKVVFSTSSGEQMEDPKRFKSRSLALKSGSLVFLHSLASQKTSFLKFALVPR